MAFIIPTKAESCRVARPVLCCICRFSPFSRIVFCLSAYDSRVVVDVVVVIIVIVIVVDNIITIYRSVHGSPRQGPKFESQILLQIFLSEFRVKLLRSYSNLFSYLAP